MPYGGPTCPVTEWTAVADPQTGDWPEQGWDVTQADAMYMKMLPQLSVSDLRIKVNITKENAIMGPETTKTVNLSVYDGEGRSVTTAIGNHYEYTGKRVVVEFALPSNESVLPACIVDSLHAEGNYRVISLGRNAKPQSGGLDRK